MSVLHQRAKDVFLASLDKAASDRLAYLVDACGEDTALRQEVESLLAFHDSAATDADAAPQGATQVFAPGELFAGRYRMITRIGRGGMGDVWRADDVILDTPVALKLIRSTAPAQRGLMLN